MYRNSFLNSKSFAAGFLILTACSPKLQVSKSDESLYQISAEMPQDAKILDYYKPFKLRLDSLMNNNVVAYADEELKRGRPVGLLNNLVTDAMVFKARQKHMNFDIVHVNYKGLRISLPQGEIMLGKIYELMPFENYLATVKLDGNLTQQLFDYMAAEGGDPIDGASFRIADKKAKDILIGGKPFDPAKTYTVLTIDYMANGGDNASFYQKAKDRDDSAYRLRDVIIEYLQAQTANGKHIKPKLDERISIEK